MNKKYLFDVEMIIDHKNISIFNEPVTVSTHRIIRGLDLSQLNCLIKNNQVSHDSPDKITLNIRGVAY